MDLHFHFNCETSFISEEPAQYLSSSFQQIANQSKTPRGFKQTNKQNHWQRLRTATQKESCCLYRKSWTQQGRPNHIHSYAVRV